MLTALILVILFSSALTEAGSGSDMLSWTCSLTHMGLCFQPCMNISCWRFAYVFTIFVPFTIWITQRWRDLSYAICWYFGIKIGLPTDCFYMLFLVSHVTGMWNISIKKKIEWNAMSIQYGLWAHLVFFFHVSSLIHSNHLTAELCSIFTVQPRTYFSVWIVFYLGILNIPWR